MFSLSFLKPFFLEAAGLPNRLVHICTHGFITIVHIFYMKCIVLPS